MDLGTAGNAGGAGALLSPDPRVSLFWAPREANADAAARLEPLLVPAEHARAARFGHPALRQRFVVGRATLRMLLAARLGVPPGDVALGRGRRGRPQLASGHALDFNVTHTGDVMLVALAEGITVGVDVEREDRAINTRGIARRCLTDAERSRLALDEEPARREVLRLWTCKEAMSKATGDALSAPFRAMDVDLADGPRLMDGPAPYVPSQWTLHALQAPAGYLATLALWAR